MGFVDGAAVVARRLRRVMPAAGSPPSVLSSSVPIPASSARAVITSRAAFCGVVPPSHRLTVAKETPSRSASCSWVRSSLVRMARSVAATSCVFVMFDIFAIWQRSVKVFRISRMALARSGWDPGHGMVTPSTALLPHPTDWDEFENMSADLFGQEWGDRDTTRYGRQGQCQNGVDVYGRPQANGYAGVQCKGRSKWPPQPLRTKDIDAEVAKAKKFRPALKEFTIVTTADDDQKLQDHARAITEQHEKEGLFSVHVVGWGEFSRRLTQHPHLVEKHYQFIALRTLREDISEVPAATAKRLVEELREIGVVPSSGQASVVPTDNGLAAVALAQAAERDLATRFAVAVKRSLFPETGRSDEFQPLAEALVEGQYAEVSSELRRRILLRAARSASVRKDLQQAETFLSRAQALPGDEPDAVARARMAEASGNVDDAIKLVRDRTDADSRSTLLNILFRARGAEAALAWLQEEKLPVSDLTMSGLQNLAVLHLHREDIEASRVALVAATEEQLADGPYLLFIRAAVLIASILPKPEQELPLLGMPLDLRRAHSVLPPNITAVRLDAAITDLTRLLPILTELQLREAKGIAEDYLAWCELLHPHRNAAGLKRLRADMADPKTALARLPFAFAYDPEFDAAPITAYLAGRANMGGLADDELRAMLVIALHGNDPKAVADLIAKHRADLEAGIGKHGTVSLEIQALAKAKESASAKLLLDDNRDLFSPDVISGLQAEIAKGEGADPVLEDMRVYEAAKTPESLRSLVGSLARKGDHLALARYAEELYQHTADPQDIAGAAQALARAGDGVNFVRVIERHPFLRERDPELARYYGWQLIQLGRLSGAKRVADELRKTPAARDVHLEINIAVESGEWETLAQPLAAIFEDSSRYSARELIQAAGLAQASGQGSMLDLMRAAIQKCEDDPHVWLGAYTLIIEEGLEDDVPEAQEWFRRALDLSGEDGPVKRFELKELLPKQLEWSERTRTINQSIVSGDLPLIIAAPALGTTVVDVVLRNLVRNSALADPRKRVAIPLFSGNRDPGRCGDLRRVGVDVSALMVMGWLGVLPKMLEAFQEIVLPAGTLYELFDGRRRIRQFQKSRLKRAQQIREAIARGRLKVLRSASS